jgi:hypothetical protein
MILKKKKDRLSLNKGLNHILIKLPGKLGQCLTYSFRLEENLPLFNHKHKYKLDSKLKSMRQIRRWFFSS